MTSVEEMTALSLTVCSDLCMYAATHWAGDALTLQSCQLSAPRHSAHRRIGRLPASGDPLWFAGYPDAWEHLTQQDETQQHNAPTPLRTLDSITWQGPGPKTYPPARWLLCLVWCGMWWREPEQRRCRYRWGQPAYTPAVKSESYIRSDFFTFLEPYLILLCK